MHTPGARGRGKDGGWEGGALREEARANWFKVMSKLPNLAQRDQLLRGLDKRLGLKGGMCPKHRPKHRQNITEVERSA